MINPIPEYKATVQTEPFLQILFQYRLSPELGGGVYKREFLYFTDLDNHLADKFGKRFATKVLSELHKSGVSSNIS